MRWRRRRRRREWSRRRGAWRWRRRRCETRVKLKFVDFGVVIGAPSAAAQHSNVIVSLCASRLYASVHVDIRKPHTVKLVCTKSIGVATKISSSGNKVAVRRRICNIYPCAACTPIKIPLCAPTKRVSDAHSTDPELRAARPEQQHFANFALGMTAHQIAVALNRLARIQQSLPLCVPHIVGVVIDVTSLWVWLCSILYWHLLKVSTAIVADAA